MKGAGPRVRTTERRPASSAIEALARGRGGLAPASWLRGLASARWRRGGLASAWWRRGGWASAWWRRGGWAHAAAATRRRLRERVRAHLRPAPALRLRLPATLRLRLPATLRRGLPRTPVGWALWLLGVVAVMSTPWAWADPALVALALDPELLTMVAAVGLALVREDVRESLVSLRKRWLRPLPKAGDRAR